MEDLVKILIKASRQPKDGSEEYKTWIAQDDFVQVLKTIPESDDVILYASFPSVFIYGVLVAEKVVTPVNINDFSHWSCDPFSSWGMTFSYGEKPDVYLSGPQEHSDSKTFDGGEQIVFAREFDGREEHRSYIEISQKITHTFDLHFVPERRAYCRFDNRGDIEDAIKILNFYEESDGNEGRAVTIFRDILDEFLVVTGRVLVILYDSTRFDMKKFGGWYNKDVVDYKLDPEIYYHKGQNQDKASFLHGFQIIRSRLTKKEVIERYRGSRYRERKYASFIVHDWKKNEVRECSCDPKYLGNYFEESDLPFEITPAFFRPEVLQKYKTDSDKYSIENRSITCRNAWFLKTYDVNEAGQVHTYLKYLSYLPYQEQLYWKSFNEAPKGTISGRAFKTDVAGEWDQQYDPLQSLNQNLCKLHEAKVFWWTLRDKELLQKANCPVTESADEWAKELQSLHKLLVEGFETKRLREKAVNLQRTIDPNWRSIKLIEECLQGLALDDDQVIEIVEPLKELNLLRAKVSSHASGKEAQRIKVGVLKKYKSYPKHFRQLCTKCDQSIQSLQELFESKNENDID